MGPPHCASHSIFALPVCLCRPLLCHLPVPPCPSKQQQPCWWEGGSAAISHCPGCFWSCSKLDKERSKCVQHLEQIEKAMKSGAVSYYEEIKAKSLLGHLPPWFDNRLSELHGSFKTYSGISSKMAGYRSQPFQYLQMRRTPNWLVTKHGSIQEIIGFESLISKRQTQKLLGKLYAIIQALPGTHARTSGILGIGNRPGVI